MQILGSFFLSYLGFEHHALSGGSGLSYWIYGSQYLSPTNPPIFIVHGIGIGIAMYFNVVKSVVSAYPERPILILELPNISLKVMGRVPSIEDTLEAVDEIFAQHQIRNCSWLAHSYGTIVTTWILKERPNYVNKITCISFYNLLFSSSKVRSTSSKFNVILFFDPVRRRSRVLCLMGA